MVTNFWITGLPRSRTAWLASFMSDDKAGVYCFHEAINGCGSMADLEYKMRSIDEPYVGNSDSGMAFLVPNFSGPTVIIERDINEVETSYITRFGQSEHLRTVLEYCAANLAKLDGLRVPYDSINDRLEDIWHHCVDAPFDRERAERMKHDHIEIDDLVISPQTVAFIGGLLWPSQSPQV